MCHSDVPISEQDRVKLSEAIRDNNYDRVKEHLLHKEHLHSMDIFMLEKEEVKGNVGEGSKFLTGMEKVNGDHSHCLF